MSGKLKFNSLDVGKILMAVCVVAMHTHPLEYCTDPLSIRLFKIVTEMAVPFFFLAAGFLLAKKLCWPFSGEENIQIIKKYLIKIVKMYLIWSLVYLPLAIYYYVSTGTGIVKAIADYLRGLLLIGEHYNSWPLWYLLSTIYALIFVIILLKLKLSLRALVIAGCIALLISVGITYFTGINDVLPSGLTIIQKILRNTIVNGRILLGSFYIPMGMYQAKKKVSIPVFILMFIAGFGLNIIVPEKAIFVLVEAIASIGLFGMIKAIKLRDSSVYPFMRKMSTVVYFIHMYIFTIYYFTVYGKPTYGLDSFLVTTGVSLLIAAIYVVCRNKLSKAK